MTRAASPVRMSRFGEYSGYSEAVYDAWVRTSQYISVRDGTRLAVDVYRPTRDGVVESKPLPVVWRAKRYLRATVDRDGNLTANLVEAPPPAGRPTAKKLIRHGYMLAAADMRGTGASFGNWSESSDPSAAMDGYDITEWLAAQPWCDGNIGMFGSSYEGRMQLSVASSAPPHLKAIMPEVSPFDWYTIIHEGGSYSARFEATSAYFRACDLDPSVSPVDDDLHGVLATEARRQHAEGNDYSATSGLLPFRDSIDSRGAQPWLNRGPEALLPGIEASGVASYHLSGWYARVGMEQLLWFSNMQRSSSAGRHRIVMGPWPGGGIANAGDAEREVWATETLRFMDFWLKGIENGIMSEPPVVYATSDAAKKKTVDRWRFAGEWPPPAEATDFFLSGGHSQTVDSVNDGTLARSQGEPGSDELQVDYSASAPSGDMAYGGEAGADLTGFDQKGLTYTSDPLLTSLEVTGHAVIHLFVSSSATDGDFIVYLEDVAETGRSMFVTRKRLRASHRKEMPAPFYYFGAPWHSNREADLQAIPVGKVVELAFDLLPTSYTFGVGHRIRVTVAGADVEQVRVPVVDPAPRITIHRDAERRSRITLPVIVHS